MSIRYYVERSLDSGLPIMVHRFFDKAENIPESAGYGRPRWMPNTSLWAKYSMGDLDEEDSISEEEANNLLSKWNLDLIQK
jgi:hypothetical protein